MKQSKFRRRLPIAFVFGFVLLVALIGLAKVLLSTQPTNRQPAKEGQKSRPVASDSAKEKGASKIAQSQSAISKPQPSSSSPTAVVAWQPSHQDDTGYNNWHEYLISGDIADRAIKKANKVKNIKAWDTSHGLTGTNNYNPQPTNTIAFDTEVAIANEARADYFISIHNDGGAPSGVLGEYLPGDKGGEVIARKLVNAISKKTGLPNRGLRAVRLYSLESNHNKAKYKCLLEIGDNVRDRAFLEDPQNRDLIADALAEIVNTFEK